MAASKNNPDKFKVVHTGVGMALAGDVITFPDGIDTERLVTLGAIEKLKGDDATEAVAYVENSQATQQTADAVSVQPAS